MKILSNQNWKSISTLSLLAIVVLSSCGGNEAPPQSAPIETQFLQLKTSNEDQVSYYPGSMEGEVNVDIKPQVSGYIQEVYVQEGSFVKKGQPLFKIKSEVFEAQVANSDATYKAAIANLANAKNEVDKIEPLVESKVVTDVQLVTAKAAYDAAKAQVAQAKASLHSSVLNKNFSLITAPVSGFVGRITNKIGTLVTLSDSNPLTTLSKIDQIFVYFSLPEKDYLILQKEQGKEFQKINLELADGSIYQIAGRLESANGNINSTTGTMTMKAIFSNPNHLLRSGGTGKVILHQQLNTVIALPKYCVKDIQDQLFVFALKDSNKIAMQPIHSFGSNDSCYFVNNGVNNGDKIATNRIDALYDGEVVKPIIKNK
ncbi:MAG: efflux RND transporter periplasmic adaptor subunit [Pseudopedobacter saltans]|uniref:Efflux RND transporter periplasmic adaptor subunit n=1 Tax=Pseudopedobacter saltans TaxID=151895 RepID=A0A2W5GTV6_9SPHI|nr:MAG: efflux RND transporter periplasmic adaptor subunit [Pseudopedobacter saltans]